MLSRPTRVILTGFGLASVIAIMSLVTGVGTGNPVVLLLVVPGFSILFPQLYLAVSDGEDAVPPAQRIRYGLLLSGLSAFAFVGTASPSERLVYASVGSFLVGALFAIEARRGYRESAPVENETVE